MFDLIMLRAKTSTVETLQSLLSYLSFCFFIPVSSANENYFCNTFLLFQNSENTNCYFTISCNRRRVNLKYARYVSLEGYQDRPKRENLHFLLPIFMTHTKKVCYKLIYSWFSAEKSFAVLTIACISECLFYR